MAKLYHWHAATTTLSGNCGTTHDAKCSSISGFTNANETSCSTPGGGPTGKPHKCYHEVPDSEVEAILKRVNTGREPEVFEERDR